MNSVSRQSSLVVLAGAVGAELRGAAETPISDIVYDSRLVTPGALFVALRGGYVDGHDFIARAIRAGASAIMVERNDDFGVPALIVPDSRAALSPLASEFFEHPSRELEVVGVTGTDGKTSTSTIAEAMIANAGHTAGLIGTVQVKIGNDVLEHETRQTTPESLDIHRTLRTMADRGVSWALLEATSHGLALHRLDDVRFSTAAVTNITHEHIDFHGTRAAYWEAKKRLFELTTATGGRKAVVNLDDAGSRSVLDACNLSSTLTYSREDVRADLLAVGVEVDGSGFHGRFRLRDMEIEVDSPLLGGFNVSNCLCAAGIALHAGVDPAAIAETLAHPPVISGRMASIDEGQPYRVIVDYAHTPASLENVLSLLRTINTTGRIIVVSGSAGERDHEKRPLQGQICARLADIAIFTSEDPRFESASAIIDQIADGAIKAGGRLGETIFTIEDRREAVDLALSLAEAGDTVLLAGKGHERSIIVEDRKIPWDEAAVARELIQSRSRQPRGSKR